MLKLAQAVIKVINMSSAISIIKITKKSKQVLALLLPVIMLLFGYTGPVLAAGAYTWTQSTSPTLSGQFCYGIASSSTGQYLACTNNGSYIIVSSDYGATWTNETSSGALSWNNISISATGQYMVADTYGGDIYTSSNYGVTWTDQTVLGAHSWVALSISANGNYILAVASNSDLYVSNNGGTSWTAENSSGALNWYSSAMSSSGQYLAAGVNGGDIYTSSNYGVTWTDQTSSGARAWIALSSSASGQYLAGTVSGGDIYTSSNYGVTWTDQTSSGARAWEAEMTMSADGKDIAAADGSAGGLLYESFDYGNTWTPDTNAGPAAGAGWYIITSSADFSRLLAVDDDGGLYMGYNPALYVNPISSTPTTNSATPIVTSPLASADPVAPNTGYGANQTFPTAVGAGILFLGGLLLCAGIYQRRAQK
jgi:hypothetical protein